MPPDFHIDLRPDRERLVLIPHGELDHFTAATLRGAIEGAVADGWAGIVLDLRRLSFMDGGGLHVLMDARDGRLGRARFEMVDGVDAVTRPVELLGGPRLLPAAAGL